MRVDGFALRPYRLPLTSPVTWGGTAYAHREGVLLRLDAADGTVGWGDAAPLPGFSRETASEAGAALAAAAPPLVGRALSPSDVLDADGPLHRALDAAALPASARFALDLALAELAAQATGRTLGQALAPDPAGTLPLAGLVLDGSPDEAARLAGLGYRTVKLKVGRAAPHADAARVRAVAARLGPGVALRLDANRAWTPAQARAFAHGIADVEIAFLEEPLADPAGMPALWLDTGLPLALDETLQRTGGAAHLRGWAAAAVLKPTLVGGLAATLRLARQARAVGATPVLSAAFESGVGVRGVAALAAATGAAAAGLDPYRWLAADVLAERLPLDRPVVDVPGLFARPLAVRPA